mmetsp:Transcript_21673/g.49973  ORF Transcript_21673/g.49973 Transcript_21673/m.49973 type:complete len:88 (+) Transcript_21673:585-848(+)
MQGDTSVSSWPEIPCPGSLSTESKIPSEFCALLLQIKSKSSGAVVSKYLSKICQVDLQCMPIHHHDRHQQSHKCAKSFQVQADGSTK